MTRRYDLKVKYLPLVSVGNVDDEEQQSQDYANDGAAGQDGVYRNVHLTMFNNVQSPVLRWVSGNTIQILNKHALLRSKTILLPGVPQGSHLGPLIFIKSRNNDKTKQIFAEVRVHGFAALATECPERVNAFGNQTKLSSRMLPSGTAQPKLS